MLWFLMFLVPLHLLTGFLVGWVVRATLNIDIVAQNWIITPIYVLLTSALATLWLSRLVVPDAEKAELFTFKVFLGSMTWASFLIWAKLLIIHLGYLAPVETDFISAALLVFGTALMIQFWWTLPKK